MKARNPAGGSTGAEAIKSHPGRTEHSMIVNHGNTRTTVGEGARLILDLPTAERECRVMISCLRRRPQV